MTSRKNHNSIIFLTTLSVYLGLVLVGAPSVLAQAALTRNFDFQTEIEVKDDLDNKPDDEKLSANDFPLALVEFLNEIKQAVKNGELTLPLLTEFGAAGDFIISGIGGSAIAVNASDARLEKIVRDALSKKFYPKALALADYKKNEFSVLRVNLLADDTDLMLSVSFDKNNAARFAKFLNHKFSADAILAKNKTVKQIYKNTEAAAVGIAADNYISIVTRLPRGSLDALLTDSAK